MGIDNPVEALNMFHTINLPGMILTLNLFKLVHKKIPKRYQNRIVITSNSLGVYKLNPILLQEYDNL